MKLLISNENKLIKPFKLRIYNLFNKNKMNLKIEF